MEQNSSKVRGMVQLALFSAIIIIMAFTPFLGYIPLGPLKATTLHIPVIIASIILGPKKGAFLGFLFGLTSFINNSFISPSVISFVFTPLYFVGGQGGNILSLVICFVPRILVGVVPYYVYRGICKLIKGGAKKAVALTLAGIAGALTNTVLVMSMIYIFFGSAYAEAKGIVLDAFIPFIVGVIGTNGVPEAIVAAIITAAVSGAILKVQKRDV